MRFEDVASNDKIAGRQLDCVSAFFNMISLRQEGMILWCLELWVAESLPTRQRLFKDFQIFELETATLGNCSSMLPAEVIAREWRKLLQPGWSFEFV